MHYDGDTLELLPSCRPQGVYSYVSVTPKQDLLAIRDASELQGRIALSTAHAEAKLQQYGMLRVEMMIAGRFEAAFERLGTGELSGSCDRATHFIHAASVGAFAFFAGSGVDAGAEVAFTVGGAEAHQASDGELLNRDGDLGACATRRAALDAPPEDCGAFIGIELVRIDDTAQCPSGEQWNGTKCAAPACPPGSTRIEGMCVGSSGSSDLGSNGRIVVRAADEAVQSMRTRAATDYPRPVVGFSERIVEDARAAAAALDTIRDAENSCTKDTGRGAARCVVATRYRMGAIYETLLDTWERAGNAVELLSSEELTKLERLEALGQEKTAERFRRERTTLWRDRFDAELAGAAHLAAQYHGTAYQVSQKYAVRSEESDALPWRLAALEERLGPVQMAAALESAFTGTPLKYSVGMFTRADKAKQLRVGHWLFRGTQKDAATAAGLYSAACDQGNIGACVGLGVAYKFARGLERDLTKAVNLFRLACDGGDMEGCTRLGTAHALGEGIPKDIHRASELFRDACAGGDTDGCVALSVAHSAGRGVPKDDAKAADLLAVACDRGDMRGCRLLGDAFSRGRGVPVDEARAVQLHQRAREACAQGELRACTAAPAPARQDAQTDSETPDLTAEGPVFDAVKAREALRAAAHIAADCRGPNDPTGAAVVTVTFSNSGRVSIAALKSETFGGTDVGGCMAAAFRAARVPPFVGAAVTAAVPVTFVDDPPTSSTD